MGMRLEELLLKKDEVVILESPDNDGNSRPDFRLPIHQSLIGSDEDQLVKPGVKIKNSLAREIFPKVVDGWYNDLKIYRKSLDTGHSFLEGNKLSSYREWIDTVYMKGNPYVEDRGFCQRVMPLGTWEDSVHVLKNGFVQDFMINRDYGGSLYVDWTKRNRVHRVTHTHIGFSPEKFAAYSASGEEAESDSKSAYMNVFSFHNVDYYPGALFLRNWALTWHNEALKQINGKKI